MEKITKRIELKLKSNKIKPLSAWQLQEFINNVGKGYSKLDIINEISRLLNNGYKPENIIIINKSYEINNSYNYLRKLNEVDLNKEDMVERFYNLGRPISMYPNEYIKNIEIIFNLYEKIYTLFGKNRIDNIPKSKLEFYINLEFEDAIKKLKADIMERLYLLKKSDAHKFSELEKELDKYISDSKNNYKNYKKDEFKRIQFKNLYKKNINKLDQDEKSEYIYMDQKYYSRFFTTFIHIERPIILIYDEQSNKLSIVKKEYMLNEVESKNFLDYKDYSHNSPFVITMIAGGAMVLIASIIYKSIEKEKENVKKEESLRKKEEELKNDIRDTIISLSKSNDLNQVKNIEDSFLKSKLIHTKGKIEKNTEATLRRNGVINNNVIINFQDYKESKQISKEENKNI